MSKKALALIGASSLLLSVLPLGASAQTGATVVDYQATDAAIADATEISTLWASNVEKSDYVIIATGASFADALSSGTLQGAKDAPLFFIADGNTVDATTIAQIKRLKATKAYVLGGNKAITAAARTALSTQAGLTSLVNVTGPSRIETSIAVAKAAGAKDNTVILARAYGDGSQGYADALAAGAWGAKTGYPVVLVGPDANGPLHKAVAEYLTSAGITKAYVVGGAGAVSEATLNAVKGVVANTTRVSGPTREETALEIAKMWGATTKAIVVDGHATTNGFHNGFAAALSAKKVGAPILLSNGNAISDPVKAKITATSGITAWTGTNVTADVVKAVAAKSNAAVKKVDLKGAKDETVATGNISPTDLGTVTYGSTPNSRVYTLTGATAGKTYTIRLALADMKDGKPVLKKDTAGNIVYGAPAAFISIVNGSKQSGTPSQATASPVNGVISFTVEAGKQAQAVIPVAVENNKVVGVGGPVQVFAGEAPNATAFKGVITSVDTTAKSFTAKLAEEATPYAANDIVTVFYGAAGNQFNTAMKTSGTNYFDAIGTSEATKFINATDFEKGLSVGDAVYSPAYYQKAKGLASKFYFNNINPAAPASVTVAPSNTSAEVTVNLGGGMKDNQIQKVEVLMNNVALTKAPETGATFVLDDATKPTKATYTEKSANGTAQEVTLKNIGTFTDTKIAKDSKVTFKLTGLTANVNYAIAVRVVTDTESSSYVAAVPFRTTPSPTSLAISKIERLPNQDPIGSDGKGEAFLWLITVNNDMIAQQTSSGDLLAPVAKSFSILASGEGNSPMQASKLEYADKDGNPLTANANNAQSMQKTKYILATFGTGGNAGTGVPNSKPLLTWTGTLKPNSVIVSSGATVNNGTASATFKY